MSFRKTDLMGSSEINLTASTLSFPSKLNVTAKSSRSNRFKSPTEEIEEIKGQIRLEDQMNNETLEELQRIFEDSDADGLGGLDMDEFREAMYKTMEGKPGPLPDDEELGIIFMKVDANCDGTVDWDEFCSFMLLENQLKDEMSSLSKDVPFQYPVREMPSAHRDIVVRITCFSKSGQPADELDPNHGRYLSVGRDGILMFWDMDCHAIKSVTLNEGKVAGKCVSTWITDCIILPNIKKLAVSTSEREIVFYDTSTGSFDKYFIVTGLQDTVLTMDYWCNPRNLNQSILLFGDTGGTVSCIVFRAIIGGLFDVNLSQSGGGTGICRRIAFADIISGGLSKVKGAQFKHLHSDWVRKVKYFPSLECFISCSATSAESMFLGDVDMKKMKSYFQVRKGISCFDYSSNWNVIVTGGLDHDVRIWNPYVNKKPTSVLKGHTSAILYVAINNNIGHVISISQENTIKVHDIRDQCCIQTVGQRYLPNGLHFISSIFYNHKNQSLLVGSNQVHVFEKGKDDVIDETEFSSHTKPVCMALYNDLFDQVVSASHDSVVSVWNVFTGEKVIQFAEAHGDDEITAMTFDPTKRRLVTGGRDGAIRVWNFNNGALLTELHTNSNNEITGITFTKDKIIAVGWDKNVYIFNDARENEENTPKIFSTFHKDDVLSLSCYRSHTLASCSYDGEVKVFDLQTGQVWTSFNASEHYTKIDYPNGIQKTSFVQQHTCHVE